MKSNIAFFALCFTVLGNIGMSIWWASSITTTLAFYTQDIVKVQENSKAVSVNSANIQSMQSDLGRIEDKLDRLITDFRLERQNSGSR